MPQHCCFTQEKPDKPMFILCMFYLLCLLFLSKHNTVYICCIQYITFITQCCLEFYFTTILVFSFNTLLASHCNISFLTGILLVGYGAYREPRYLFIKSYVILLKLSPWKVMWSTVNSSSCGHMQINMINSLRVICY